MTVLFFAAIARHAVWGNTLVKNYFGYHDMPNGTGQTWAFSTNAKGSNLCLTEPFKGISLHDLWWDHQELFHREGKSFPVIISLVGPEENLSVQIHPNARRAAQIGCSMGKNEAWYFLDCIPDAEIVYGHNAENEKEFRQMAKKNQWNSLLRHLPVKKDDFVYTPAGTVHGVGRGCVTYEIQQSTDITYRLYDYHRLDTDGKERPINFEEGVCCITSYPQKYKELPPSVVKSEDGGDETVLISNDSFTVTRIRVHGNYSFHDENYQLATAVKGTGKVNSITISIGDSFLIPCNEPVVFEGNDLMIMMTRN